MDEKLKEFLDNAFAQFILQLKNALVVKSVEEEGGYFVRMFQEIGDKKEVEEVVMRISYSKFDRMES